MKCYSFCFIFLLPLSLFASDWTMEVRAAYFSPSSKEVRKTYSSGWVDFQVESSKKLNDFIEVWTGVCWMNKHGHLEDRYAGIEEKTKLSVLPISVGLKFTYPLTRCLDVYIGAGGACSFLKLKNNGEYSGYESSLLAAKSHIRRSGWGGVAKLGVRWTLGPTTFIDLFADYFEQRFHLGRHSIYTSFHRHLNCSGFKLGGGFGVYF